MEFFHDAFYVTGTFAFFLYTVITLLGFRGRV